MSGSSYARRGYDEAHAAAREAKLEVQQCEAVARDAWKQCLPLLSSREHVPPFIACTIHGMQAGLVTPEEARVMLYGAQMALASFRQVVR